MDPVRYQRVKQLLLAALELPEAERAAFLDAECGDDLVLRREVDTLLDQDDSGNVLLDEGVLGQGTQESLRATIQRLGHDAAVPERIGPYEVVGVLGEGGMGMVYHGRQSEPFERDVAVKVLRPGLDGARVMARFEWERRALARLDHPNIARVLDAGTDPDSGRPFVALPLIDGVPITRHCELVEPTLEDRLQLFLRVCRAVEHAHARGVLHRDLKPGNVMVQQIDGEAVPVVIDFGIAKALDPDTTGIEATMTVEGQRIGTPAYMSPEQLHGDPGEVDVRADVYALGVILWEMLTGVHPYGEAADSVTRALQIGRQPPPLTPPSRETRTTRSVDRWRRRLRGDLDTICLRAVEFDRTRRYASAAHLADDVQRFLEGRPILARPDSWTYRMGKSMRRHPVITTAVVGALTVLLTGTALLAYNAQRLSVERDRAVAAEQRARAEAEQARAIADFLSELFTEVDPVSGSAADLSARELLAQGARRARASLGETPELRGPLLYTMGFVQHQLGLYVEAESLLVEALADLEALDDVRGDSLTVETVRLLGINRHDQGRYAEAEVDARRAAKLIAALYGTRDPRYGAVLSELAIDVQAQGRLEEGIELLKQSLAVHESTPEPRIDEIAWTRGTIGYVLSKLDRNEESAAWLQSAYDLFVTQPESEQDKWELIYHLNNLGGINMRLERYDPARKYLGEALGLAVEMHGDDHPVVGRAYTMAGSATMRAGDVDAAAAWIEKGEQIQRRVLGNEHLFTARSILTTANLRHAQGRLDEALQLARESLGIRQALSDPDTTSEAEAQVWIARILLETGRAAEALEPAADAVAIYRAARGSDHAHVLQARTLHAWALFETGRLAETRAELDGLVDALRARHGDEHVWTRRATEIASRLEPAPVSPRR